MEAYVKSATHNGITSVEFFHPQSNSLPAQVLADLATAIRRAGEDPNTIVIILRSAGEKAFCAGASFDELLAVSTSEEGTHFFSGFANSSESSYSSGFTLMIIFLLFFLLTLNKALALSA